MSVQKRISSATSHESIASSRTAGEIPDASDSRLKLAMKFNPGRNDAVDPDQEVFKSSSLALLQEKRGKARRSKHYKGAKRVLQFMYGMWKNKRLCDVLLQASQQELFAHKIALAAYSDSLATAFEAYPLGEIISIDLTDFSADVLQTILRFIYTTDIELTDRNVEDIVACAIQLGIQVLVEMCEDHLKKLEPENVMKYCAIAERHSLTNSIKHMHTYIGQHFEMITSAKSFLLTQKSSLFAWLTNENLMVRNELNLFHAIVKWIDFNKQERLKYAPELLKCVRLQNILPEELVTQVERVDHIFHMRECHDQLYEAMRYHALKFSGSKLVKALNPQIARKYQPTEKTSKREPLSPRISSAENRAETNDNNSASMPAPRPKSVVRRGSATSFTSSDSLGHSDDSLEGINSDDQNGSDTNLSVSPFALDTEPEMDGRKSRLTTRNDQPIRNQRKQKKYSTNMAIQEKLAKDRPAETRHATFRGQENEYTESRAEYHVTTRHERHRDIQSRHQAPRRSHVPDVRVMPSGAIPHADHIRGKAQTPSPKTATHHLESAPVDVDLLAVTAGGIDYRNMSCQFPGKCIHKYDPSTNHWSMVARLQDFTHHHGVGVLHGKVYVVGGAVYDQKMPGQLGIATKSAFEFDPRKGRWSSLQSMLDCRAYLGVAVHATRLYAVGGEDDKRRRLDTIEYYDLDTHIWAPMSRMPGGPKIGMAVLAFKDHLYIVGGYNREKANPILSDVECYDLYQHRWVPKNPLNFPRCHANLVEIRERLYAVGGRSKVGAAVTSLTQIEVYNEYSDVWEHVADLRVPRHDAGCAALDTRLYIVGGVTSPNPSSLCSVECLDLESSQWIENVNDFPFPVAGLTCCAAQLY